MSSKERILTILLIEAAYNDEQTFQITVRYIQLGLKLLFKHQIGTRQIRLHLKRAEEEGLIARHRHDQENGRLGPEAQATSYEIPDLKKTLKTGLRSINKILSSSPGRGKFKTSNFSGRS